MFATLFDLPESIWLAVVGILAMSVKEYFDRRRLNTVRDTAASVAADATEAAEKAATKAEKVAREAAAKTAEVATAALEVKRTLDQTTAKTDAKLATIHGLVNSARGVTLRALSLALKRIANDSGLPEDIEAAKEAEKESLQHEASQVAVDAKATRPTN